MAKEDIVVVAVDGSDASKNAVRWAANTAMKREIPLRIELHHTAIPVRRGHGPAKGPL